MNIKEALQSLGEPFSSFKIKGNYAYNGDESICFRQAKQVSENEWETTALKPQNWSDIVISIEGKGIIVLACTIVTAYWTYNKIRPYANGARKIRVKIEDGLVVLQSTPRRKGFNITKALNNLESSVIAMRWKSQHNSEK